VDPALVRRLTAALAYAAPDGSAAWGSAGVGLGFAYLRRTSDRPARSAHPPMPATDGAGLHLVADADLDDRQRLKTELADAGYRLAADADDAALVLAAYRTWGARCPEHLHGDFAFGLWDAPRRRLLLARDRFGTRPLYIAQAGGLFAFSNSLDVVRTVPGVSAALDEGAVGDLLRIGYDTDPAGTLFSAVRCVPPAHTVCVEEGVPTPARYWDLPTDGRIRLPNVNAYADRFAELLGMAVADRVRDVDSVAIMLSGGRDSTAVAAIAREVADRMGGPHLHAVTGVFDYALPDEERTYAALAASALRIPAEFVPQDEYGWYEGWDEPEFWRPEPPESPALAAEIDLHARAAARAGVALTGEGGDAVLRESESRLARLMLAGHGWRAAEETARYVKLHRRLPRPGFRRLRLRRHGLASPYSPVPPWLRPDFIARAGLDARWRALQDEDERQRLRHPVRPEAFTKTRSSFWARCFEEEHSTATGQWLTFRHPFFDERVVEFLLALPAEQWLNDKGIVVAAMRTRLPHPVVYRNKTPLIGDPYEVAFRRHGRRPARGDFTPAALEFIEPDALFEVTPGMQGFEAWDWVRAFSFSRWIERLPGGRRLPRDEDAVALDFSG
jgi:asparagine synthase (glutamine-hydrolysing)